VEYYRGIIHTLQANKKQAERELREVNKVKSNYKKAREVLLVVAATAQQTAKQKIETLVTAAIQAVYDRDFVFKLKFEQKRNRSTARPVICEGEAEYNAKEDLGGGMVDLVSFALRIVVWSMQHTMTRPTIILDEPMKFVGQGELLGRAAAFIKNISQELGIQFILLTHEPQLAEIADKAWDVTHSNGKSKVKERT
jgi:DNA repair ATPase RecN